MNISKPSWQCPDCSGSQSRQLLLGIPPNSQNSSLSLSYLKTCFGEIGIHFFLERTYISYLQSLKQKSQVLFRSKWRTRPQISPVPELQVISGMVPRSKHKGTPGIVSQEARRQDSVPEAETNNPQARASQKCEWGVINS